LTLAARLPGENARMAAQRNGLAGDVAMKRTSAGCGASNSGWGVYAFAAFLIGSAYFVVMRLGSLWTWSVDLAFHCAIVSRLMSGEHFYASDPVIDVLAGHPSISHSMAAIVGGIVDSPVMGLQVVALVFLIAMWGTMALAAGATRIKNALLPTFLALVLLNGLFPRAEIFGNEIIGNYFFPQLVSQSLAVGILLLSGNFERRGVSPEIRYFFLALCVPMLVFVHLFSALEVAGVLLLLVISDCYFDLRLRQAIFWGSAVVVAVLTAVFHPYFPTWVLYSHNNGALTYRYIGGAGGAVMLATITLAISAGVLYQLSQLDAEDRADRLFLKYVAAFGVSCSSLHRTIYGPHAVR
jgi:hypothetical protein